MILYDYCCMFFPSLYSVLWRKFRGQHQLVLVKADSFQGKMISQAAKHTEILVPTKFSDLTCICKYLGMHIQEVLMYMGSLVWTTILTFQSLCRSLVSMPCGYNNLLNISGLHFLYISITWLALFCNYRDISFSKGVLHDIYLRNYESIFTRWWSNRGSPGHQAPHTSLSSSFLTCIIEEQCIRFCILIITTLHCTHFQIS